MYVRAYVYLYVYVRTRSYFGYNNAVLSFSGTTEKNVYRRSASYIHEILRQHSEAEQRRREVVGW